MGEPGQGCELKGRDYGDETKRSNGYAVATKRNVTTHDDYQKIATELLALAKAIEDSKRPGYTLGNADVLHNFKSVAARIGITPGQAWAIYFLKHIDAITTIMCKPDLPVSEEPIGRFADAVNYLKLGFALFSER